MYGFDKENSSFTDFKVTNSKHENHAPNPEKIKRHEINTAVRSIVSTNINMKTSEVVEEVSNQFVLSVSDSPSTGKIAHLKRNIRNTRRKLTGERRIGTSKEDFELPLELQVTKPRKDGVTTPFLLQDIPGAHRTLIFATRAMLQVCVFSKQICMQMDIKV
jgi:hypothetical protein